MIHPFTSTTFSSTFITTHPKITPMTKPEILNKNAISIENKLNYKFKDRSLLLLAFTHRSYINENREIDRHNERLEFLGDAVLGLLISNYLYRYLPSTPEGDLSYLRSRLVEASACVTYVQKLDVNHHILLGKGERMNNSRGRDSILADLFEAIIGAIYLDGGVDAASHFLFKNFSKEIEQILSTPEENWKATLQDYCQKEYQEPPTYEVIDESGPDHSKTFLVRVLVNGEEMGMGKGKSKKIAQQEAAQKALTKLELA